MFKRCLTIILLFLLSSGCGLPARPLNLGPLPPSGLRDGAYVAEASHFPAKVKVEVRIESGKLTDITLLEHRYGKGGPAGDIMPGRILSEQSTDVDGVSGATGSSRLIMEAVQKAIDQARAG